MSHRTKSKRKNPPNAVVLEHRRTWGARLLVELNSLRKTPEWLGEQLGFKEHSSTRQIINGHQPMSLEVYMKIIELVPEMMDVPVLTHFLWGRQAMGTGALGPHKAHAYPKLGSRASRRPS